MLAWPGSPNPPSNCNKKIAHTLFTALSFSIVRKGLGNRARFPPRFLGAVFRELIQSAHRLSLAKQHALLRCYLESWESLCAIKLGAVKPLGRLTV